MTRQEVFKIIMALKAVYNTAYSKYTPQDFDNLASAWEMCLEDYDYKTVSMALKAYMTTNTSQFPPVPAQIIDEIHKLNPTEQPLNGSEAWALVYRAICNSGYYAEQEFNKLPPTIQKAVGSPDNLRAWALDADFNNGVEQSHFIKVYNTTLEREKEIAKLPNSVKKAVGIQVQERVGITG